MTEYEMTYLLNEMQNSGGNQASTMFTTVTAFLVAGYLAGHQLTRFMVSTVIGLYTIWLFGSFVTISRTLFTMRGLVIEMKEFAQHGKGLDWHFVVQTPRDDTAWWAVVAALWVTFAAIYVASLVFFFHCRRLHRKAEASAWKPKV